MGLVNTTTAGGSQQGNIGGGLYAGDFSEGKNQNAATQGGVITGGGAGNVSQSQTLSASGAGSTVNLTQESPEAIAALNNVAQAALAQVGSTAHEAIAYEQATAQSAEDDAYNNAKLALETAKSALTPGDARTYKFAGIALGLVALVAVAYIWSKKNG